MNVKVDPEWRDFWRNTYSSVIPAYHQNKEHWNSIILDGTIPDTDIKRMIAESYDLICKRNKKNSKMASVQKRIGAFSCSEKSGLSLCLFGRRCRHGKQGLRGITVEIGGDTTGLDKALRGVNSSITKTQSALNDVNKLLKLDPSNTVLVAQKQQLLSQAVSQTSDKLEALESAQEQVTAAFQRGDIGQDKYQAFQREIEETRGKLNQYKNDLSSLQTEQDRLSSNTARLEKLFSSTGTQVDDYADVLGSKLVSAIKNGTANSDQMKTAIEKIGKSATGGKADIRQLTDALDTVDDGEAIRNLIEELKQAGDAAQDTAEDVGQIAENTKGAALMQTADQLSAVGDKIQDIGTKSDGCLCGNRKRSHKKVNAYFGETGQAAEDTANVIKSVYSDGVGESMDSVADAVLMVKRTWVI